MFNVILTINKTLNSIVWGPLMIVAIIGVGLYLTIGTNCVQVARFKHMWRETLGWRRKKHQEGDISPFQALNVALAGTVGVGNIAGVATAIAFGGPGAIFWMWVSGFLGMATKFAEVVLGVHYRMRQIGGPMVGGPMVYIRRGMGKNYRYLAGAFAVLGALAAFEIGNMVQAHSVADGAAKFGVPPLVTGIVLMIAVGLVGSV